MSTSQTEHYRLHSWSKEDKFLLDEINENFAAIDAALGGKNQPVGGSYTGDRVFPRHIDLGGRPLAVLVEYPSGARSTNSGSCYGGLAVQGVSHMGHLVLDETGFTLQSDFGSLNNTGLVYTYLAVLEP